MGSHLELFLRGKAASRSSPVCTDLKTGSTTPPNSFTNNKAFHPLFHPLAQLFKHVAPRRSSPTVGEDTRLLFSCSPSGGQHPWSRPRTRVSGPDHLDTLAITAPKTPRGPSLRRPVASRFLVSHPRSSSFKFLHPGGFVEPWADIWCRVSTLDPIGFLLQHTPLSYTHRGPSAHWSCTIIGWVSVIRSLDPASN